MSNSIDNTVKIYNRTTIVNSSILSDSSIGDFTKVVNCRIDNNVRIDRNNHLDSSEVGSFSYTGKNTTILHAQIGKFCSISWNVTVGGADHDYTRICQHSILYNSKEFFNDIDLIETYDRYKEEVVIGHDVWIGASAFVKRGVRIGNGAVIGANSVVTTDVPRYAIVAGSPARIIKYRFGLEDIQKIDDLNWWNWPIEKIKREITFLSSKP
jgi:virginiamycin A acetyltransferase